MNDLSIKINAEVDAALNEMRLDDAYELLAQCVNQNIGAPGQMFKRLVKSCEEIGRNDLHALTIEKEAELFVSHGFYFRAISIYLRAMKIDSSRTSHCLTRVAELYLKLEMIGKAIYALRELEIWHLKRNENNEAAWASEIADEYIIKYPEYKNFKFHENIDFDSPPSGAEFEFSSSPEHSYKIDPDDES